MPAAGSTGPHQAPERASLQTQSELRPAQHRKALFPQESMVPGDLEERAGQTDPDVQREMERGERKMKREGGGGKRKENRAKKTRGDFPWSETWGTGEADKINSTKDGGSFPGP